MVRPADILMWVGADHYPTIASFVGEAERMGVAKGIAQVPVGVKLGQSLLFLAHDEAARMTCRACRGRGVARGRLTVELVERRNRRWVPVEPTQRRTVGSAGEFRRLRDATYAESGRARSWRGAPGHGRCAACAGRGEVPAGRIFGVCRIDRLELVFDCQAAATEYEDRRERCGHRDRVKVTYVVGGEDDGRRRAGYRRIGGLYLVSQDTPQAATDLAGQLGNGCEAHGPLIVFSRPVAYPGGRFLGAAVVDGADILRQARGAASRRKKVKRARPRPAAARGDRRPPARRAKRAEAAARGAHRRKTSGGG